MPRKIIINNNNLVFRRSWTRCTSTSLAFTWFAPTTSCSCRTLRSGLTSSRKPSSSESRPTRTRRSLNSRSITIRLQKDSEIPELADHRKSKNIFLSIQNYFRWNWMYYLILCIPYSNEFILKYKLIHFM